MEFIHSCAKIENLSQHSVDQLQCVDRVGMYMVTEGSARATLEDRVYFLQAGELLLTPPRARCFFKAEGQVLGYSFDCRDPLPYGAYRVGVAQMPFLQAVQTAGGASLYPLMELLLCSIEDYVVISPTENREIALFQAATEVMEANLKKRVLLEEMVQRLGLSLSHLKRLFSEYAGMGAHDYYMLLKICRAKEYLLEGMSVTDTAVETGFANQAYFSAAFKRIAGVSPKDFAGVQVKRRPVKSPSKERAVSRRDLPDYLL